MFVVLDCGVWFVDCFGWLFVSLVFCVFGLRLLLLVVYWILLVCGFSPGFCGEVVWMLFAVLVMVDLVLGCVVLLIDCDVGLGGSTFVVAFVVLICLLVCLGILGLLLVVSLVTVVDYCGCGCGSCVLVCDCLRLSMLVIVGFLYGWYVGV